MAGQDGDMGRAYLETQQAMGQICGENRPILVPFLPFSASVGIRQLPLSPVGFHFGPHLGSVDDGNMSGRQDGDVGGAYLETQQGLSQIFG